MKKAKPELGLIEAKDLILFGAYYAYTSGRVNLESGKGEKRVTQAYFVRKIPEHLGSYILAVGLEQTIAYIQALKEWGLRPEHQTFFEATSGGDMSEDFIEYLYDWKPRFNIWAVPEGTPMFPNEPIMLVEGKAIDIQIIEDALLSNMNHQSLIATKTSRMRYACGKRSLVDFGSRRAHGWGAALNGARASYIGGTDGTSLVLAGYKYGIPYVGTVPHAFIQIRQDSEKTFSETELEAFMEYASIFPHNTLLLVDTYNSINGVINAIQVGRWLRKKGYELKGIRLDSGNLSKLAKTSREMLDNAGMQHSKIYVSDNIDEFQIMKLLDENAPIDGFGVGTCLQTGANFNSITEEGGVSALGGIFKVIDVDKNPNMKFTDNKSKSTNPGKQQVWRVYDPKGMYYEDFISTWGELLEGEYVKQLLMMIMSHDEIIYNFPTVKEIREYSINELKKLKPGFKRIIMNKTANLTYPVSLSPDLEKLKENMNKKYCSEFEVKKDTDITEEFDKFMKIVEERNNLEERMRWDIKHKWGRVS